VSVAIGDTESVRIVLDKRLPAGPWHARVNLRSGLLSRNAAATITFPAAEASSSWPGLVIIGLLGLVGVLLAVTTLLIARRRRRRPPATDNDNSRRTHTPHAHHA
jgi:hypothetical protein